MLLAAMTLATVIAFDSRAMVRVLLVWCVVWYAAHSPRCVAAWSDLGRRIALATGAGWVTMWLGLLATFERNDIGWRADFVTAGFPRRAFVGLASKEHGPIETNFVGAFLPPPGCGPPHLYEANHCVDNFVLAVLLAAVLMVRLPPRHLPSLLLASGLLGAVLPLLVLGFLPLGTDNNP